ncbi:MAG: hypothetical protein ACLT8I_12060 [Blautia faecis]
MRDSIIMTKYQGFGNDYLVLDAKKNQLQLQGKKVALLCQRGVRTWSGWCALRTS